MPNYELLFNDLSQDKYFKGRMTLCIDIVNVFLAKINLEDDKDLESFMNCKDIDRNVVIVKKKENVKCKHPEKCKLRKINGVC